MRSGHLTLRSETSWDTLRSRQTEDRDGERRGELVHDEAPRAHLGGSANWLSLLLLLPMSLHAQNVGVEHRVVSTSGSADVRVQPDHVVLQLGVEVRDADLAVAMKEHDARFERVVKYLRETLGAPNVRADHISINPTYQWESTQRKYFTVQKTLIATIKDISLFDTILHDCVSRGATNVQGVQFRTTELKKHRENARSLAIAAAREKAQKLALSAGVKIGGVLSISESSWGGASSWSPSGGFWGDGTSNSQVSVAAASPTGGDSGPTLPLGELNVTATVQMSFEIE